MESKQQQALNNNILKHASIYELNIRQFTSDSKFLSIIPHLKRIKHLGINIIWMMPIHPIGITNRKGSLGSYYAVKDYLDVNPEFGSIDDFKVLINEIHKLDMVIILDWVANHTSTDHIWTQSNKEYYKMDKKTNEIVNPQPSWNDVYQLNYENPEMRQAMINAMTFWVKEFNIDGFRCDVAYMVPPDFWTQANNQIRFIKSDIIMLCEADESMEKEVLGNFQISYAFSLMKWMKINKNGKNKKFKINAGKQFSEDLNGLKAYIQEYQSEYMQNIFKLFYVSNHDENSANGGEYQLFGEEGARLYIVLAYTLPGIPLVYSGQEIPIKRSLQFFEKDAINWEEQQHNQQFLTQLLTLHNINEAMWSGLYGGKLIEIENSAMQRVFSFIRQKNSCLVIVILNFSPEIIEIETKLSNEVLQQQIQQQDNQQLNFENIFNQQKIKLQRCQDQQFWSMNLSMQPYGYYVLEKK